MGPTTKLSKRTNQMSLIFKKWSQLLYKIIKINLHTKKKTNLCKRTVIIWNYKDLECARIHWSKVECWYSFWCFFSPIVMGNPAMK